MVTIKDIFWERVNFHLLFSEDIERYEACLEDRDNRIVLSPKKSELVINVTNTPEGQMLEPGRWTLTLWRKGEEGSKCLVSVAPELLKILDDKSRIFRYRAGQYAYLVDFSIDDSAGMVIRTDFMLENRNWKRFYLFREARTWSGKGIVFLKKAYLLGINLLYRAMRLLKWNSKKNVLFFTENSDVLNGNLKLLYDSVPEESCNKLLYANDNFSSANAGKLHKVIRTIKGIYFLAQSDVVFVDNYVPKLTHIKLNKQTRLIQLWHAGVGFKSVGYARFGLTGSPHPCHSCHRNYTDVIVDREDLIEIYQEVFGVKKENMKALGMPRLDGYLSQERIERTVNWLYSVNGSLEKKKVILFAPTFRGTGSRNAYYDSSFLDLERVYDFCQKNDFLFLIKMHPFIEASITIAQEYSDVILDYSKYEINDLIYISDVMITDYSSCAYEFSMFQRPLIFFRPDKERYEYERPVHTLEVFSEQQFEVRTMEGLIEVLEELTQIDVSERFICVRKEEKRKSCDEIRRLFLDGDASR